MYMVIELVNNNNIYYNKKNTACNKTQTTQQTITEYQNTSSLAAITVAIRAI